jgi:hypothetical protein
MRRQNMGRLDRTVRLIAGVALIPIALFVLGGWQGTLSGILVGAFSLVLLLTSLTGFCPVYVPLGVSTSAGEGVREEPSAPGTGERFEGGAEEMAGLFQCPKAMPQMMAMCCGAQGGEEETVPETSERA